MAAIETYHQDTTKAQSLIKTLPPNQELRIVPDRQKPVSILELPSRHQSEATPTKKTYTNEQIKSWRLQQQSKLKVNGSQYIVPRSDITLGTSQNTPQIHLPNRLLNSANTDWLTVIIFLCILLFAGIRYNYSKYLGHLFLSLFNYSTSSRMLQEKNYQVFHAAFRLEAIFYISLSVFLFQILNVTIWENSNIGPLNFFIILALVLLYFFGKKFIYIMLGSMFEAGFEAREYLFNMNNFNRSLGLILLPTVILSSFAPLRNPMFIILLGVFVVAIFNLLLLRRSIFILLKKQFSIFYLFLYLCTLEFLPLLLIFKVVVE